VLRITIDREQISKQKKVKETKEAAKGRKPSQLRLSTGAPDRQ
jgi:hypothetical protein